MADSQAILAYNTTLEVEDRAGIRRLVRARRGHQRHPAGRDRRRRRSHPHEEPEFLQGIPARHDRPGHATFKLNNIPNDTTDAFIAAWRASRLRRATRLTFPNGATRTFSAYPKGFVQDAMDPGKAITATLTLKVAGQVVRG
jgi:hypothetical protein